MNPTPRSASVLPPHAGIGLRDPHHREVLETWPATGWVEVHSENFFGQGGEPLRVLEAVRERYPVSLHGVGMSLGSSDELSLRHLTKLKTLAERSRAEDVYLICQCGEDKRCHRELLLLLACTLYGAATAPLRFAYPVFESRMRDRKSTRLNSSHAELSRMPSSA